MPAPYTSSVYVANGSATTFPINFFYESAAELVVQVNGVSAAFTASGNGVSFSKPPAYGSVVEVSRKTNLARDITYTLNGVLSAVTLNRDFDRLWRALQEISDQGLRALRVPAGDSTTPDRLLRDLRTLLAAYPVDLADLRYTLGRLAQGALSIGATFYRLKNAPTAPERLLGDKLSETVSVQDFGAKGDGVTDDYDALQAAFAHIQQRGGGTLTFPAGTYFLNRHRIDGGPLANGLKNFTLTNCNGVRIEGYGAKIVMQGGWTRVTDSSYAGFTFSYHNNLGFDFTDCKGLAISGLEIDGGAATITKIAAAEGMSYGINLRGCENVTLTDLYVHHFCTDGLGLNASGTVGAYRTCKNVTAINCRFVKNARQGMSIMQCRRAVFIGCDFSDTGNTGTYGGHSPQGGVDIEPDYYPGQAAGINGDDFTGDIHFLRCTFRNNMGFEFVNSGYLNTPHPITLTACDFSNTNNINPVIATTARVTRFSDCHFDNVSVLAGYATNDKSRTELQGCKLVNRRAGDSVLFCANPAAELIVRGCDIQLMATSPHSSYRLYCQSPGVVLESNDIFISGAEYAGSGSYDVYALMQSANLRNNRWSTNLTGGGLLVISVDGGTINDHNLNPQRLSIATFATGSPRMVSDIAGFDRLVTNAGNTFMYGSGPPGSGTWRRGDRVLNTAPAVGQPKGWVCVEAGTPGNWVSEGDL